MFRILTLPVRALPPAGQVDEEVRLRAGEGSDGKAGFHRDESTGDTMTLMPAAKPPQIKKFPIRQRNDICEFRRA